MTRGKKNESDVKPESAPDPLKAALEKGRAEREAQERVAEFRRLLGQAAGFSHPGPRWGVDYSEHVASEKDGVMQPSHEKWPEANEGFAREWVALWRQVADAARKAGLVDQIRTLDPEVSVMRDGPEHVRPLICEMHGLFVRVLDGDVKASLKVARDLATLRSRCEPSADEIKRGNVLVGRRWDAGKYFQWLRNETATPVLARVPVPAADATSTVRRSRTNAPKESAVRAAHTWVLQQSNEAGVPATELARRLGKRRQYLSRHEGLVERQGKLVVARKDGDKRNSPSIYSKSSVLKWLEVEFEVAGEAS